MACGTPVIGFDAGGIPDYVIPGETGMLAENGNSDQLADALLAAITMPTKIQTMGTRARQLILDRFQAKRQAQVYLELYRNLLGSEALTKRRAA